MQVMYVYPIWHTVSFSLIARKHVEYLRKLQGITVYELDELQITHFRPVSRYHLVLHPSMYITHRILSHMTDSSGKLREDSYSLWRKHWEQVIGIDVCDSDRYSELAVSLLNHLDKLVVPSQFCVDVAKNCGVRAKVYRVPHGVDPEWYEHPNVWESKPVASITPAVIEVFLYKIRKRKKVLLFWLWHSGDRKGWAEVREVYRRLRKERDDVILVLKTGIANPREYFEVMDLGAINIYGWLSDADKMALYDLADVTLNFSRGGGFELNCLESLARGTPCIATWWGSWKDYLPPFLGLKTGLRVQPLPNNLLHAGYGYTVDVEDAVNKLHAILDNIEEYKAKTLEWREKVLKNEYRWDIIAEKLLAVIQEQ